MITKKINDSALKKLCVITSDDVKSILLDGLQECVKDICLINGADGPIWQIITDKSLNAFYTPFSGQLVYEECKGEKINFATGQYSFSLKKNYEICRTFLCFSNRMVVIRDERRHWMTDLGGCPGYTRRTRFFRIYKK